MKPSDVFLKLRHTSTVERMIAEPRRRRLLSSSGRAPNSQRPDGSRLWHRDRLLGVEMCAEAARRVCLSFGILGCERGGGGGGCWTTGVLKTQCLPRLNI